MNYSYDNSIMYLIDRDKLGNKIQEWKSKGLSHDEIVEEGWKWCKEYLKSIPWKERRDLINQIDRDKKLEEILK